MLLLFAVAEYCSIHTRIVKRHVCLLILFRGIAAYTDFQNVLVRERCKKHRKDCETALWAKEGFIESQPLLSVSLNCWSVLIGLGWF